MIIGMSLGEISGDFELHLTGSAAEADALAAFAGRRGVKFSHIVLDRGATASQPMLTIPGSGTENEMRERATRWRADLVAAGLSVSRVKIEASPFNAGVPDSDDDATPHRYFEHHLKLVLPSADASVLDAVNAVIHGHGARLSRNARRTRADGRQERFVTQRCAGVGLRTARARLDLLIDKLRAGGFEAVEIEQEYVVDDDALHIDDGWLRSGDESDGGGAGRGPGPDGRG
jgi:hypothetical protein